MTKSLFTFLLSIAFVTACVPTSTANPPNDSPVANPPISNDSTPEKPTVGYKSQPDDVKLSRGSIFIQETGLLIRESFPPQIVLAISGNLPTPCHLIRAEIKAPDLENKIVVDVYTVVDPNTVCTQILRPFEEHIELGTFPTGHYSVWVNGELAGEFDS